MTRGRPLLKKSASALLFIKGSKTKRSASAYGSLETGGEEAKKAAEDTPMAWTTLRGMATPTTSTHSILIIAAQLPDEPLREE